MRGCYELTFYLWLSENILKRSVQSRRVLFTQPNITFGAAATLHLLIVKKRRAVPNDSWLTSERFIHLALKSFNPRYPYRFAVSQCPD